MPQIAYCPHYTSHAHCKSAADHSPPPRVANQACPTDAPLRTPSDRVRSRRFFRALRAAPMLQPSAMLGRSGGYLGGRCRLVWGARVPVGPSPLCAVLPIALMVSRADLSTRLPRCRCSSGPPCLGGSGAARGGCCRPIYDARLACGPGPSAQKNERFAWPWGRGVSRAGACKHGIALTYP